MIVDIYTHIIPDRFFTELERGSPKLGNMGKRLRSVRKLFDLDARFRDMDEIGEYRQIISLPNPPIEDIADGAVAKNLARVANDSMAELCANHPDRFPAFAAAVSMHDVDFSIAEAERAIKMGARGVQTFTNIAGHPLDEPRFRPFFAAMAAHDLPIWLHPARTSSMPDYASEPRSRFEMWWCFGWPYETTIAMARLVFDGIYDRHPKLKIITHHLGGGMIPFFDGRIGPGMDVLGARTVDEPGWPQDSNPANPFTASRQPPRNGDSKPWPNGYKWESGRLYAQMPAVPLTASPVPWLTSLHATEGRGAYGRPDFRGGQVREGIPYQQHFILGVAGHRRRPPDAGARRPAVAGSCSPAIRHRRARPRAGPRAGSRRGRNPRGGRVRPRRGGCCRA
jgi:aminocarboxymuconate-semialdehyde decarboxylase